MSNSILLAPGPVQLHPEVQKILALPMIHHRTPQFDAILKSTLENLQYVFETSRPVFMLSCTGSGGMECLLVNTLTPGDKVLAIVSGKFGERWAEMAETYGANVVRHNVEWGNAFCIDDVETILNAHPDLKIILTQACETSTATIHPIEKLGRLIKNSKVILLVDGITAIGATSLPMDEWSIDGLVGGSQKAFMLPTGMAFVSFSEKAWEAVKQNKSKKFYFDVRKEAAANAKGETYFSSNVTLIRALNFVTGQIKRNSLEELHTLLAKRAAYTRAMGAELGLELFSTAPSNSVTALTLPPGMDGSGFRDHLEKRYGVVVMGGQDQLRGKIIRIGHMGYLTERDLHETTMCLAKTLLDFGLPVPIQKIETASERWLGQNFPKDKEV